MTQMTCCSRPYDLASASIAVSVGLVSMRSSAELQAVAATGATLPVSWPRGATPAEVQLAFLAGLLTKRPTWVRRSFLGPL
jgi:hypothetical protein